MYIRDIMTPNVVTIPSDTSIVNAKKVMDEKKLRRLPVVDKGKLVGLVTANGLERVATTETVFRSIWELSSSLGSLYQTPVKAIMQKHVVTATPDMTVEEALALAQTSKVGVLVVAKNSKVVGIVTTNDFFYRIVNKVLGLGEPGIRVEIVGGGEGEAMAEIIPVGSNSGVTRKDPAVDVDKVIAVLISSAFLVDFIQFIVQKDGNPLALAQHGGNGGHLTPFLLAGDEYLTGMSGKYGTYIDSIILHTTTRTSQRFGGKGGDREYSIQANPGEQIVGLWCRSDTYIDAIGAITGPMPRHIMR